MSKSNPAFSRRRLLMQGAGAMLLLSVSRAAGVAASSHIIAVRVWPSSKYLRLTIESKIALKYEQFTLNYPERIVIDIKYLHLNLNSILRKIDQLVQKNDPYIKTVRIGQFDHNTVRIVLELKKKVIPHLFVLAPIASFKYRLVIDLYSAYDEQSDPLLTLLKEYNLGVIENHSKSTQISLSSKAEQDRPIIIMIDPGHGGEDPGAIGLHKTCEKDIVLKIGRRLKTLIDREPNMSAYMTRNEDIFIPLTVRVENARKQRADLFVSIHADAFTNRAAHGSSVFALSTKGSTSAAACFLARTQNESDLIGGVSRSGDRYLDHTMFDMVQSRTISDSLKFGIEVLNRMGKINHLHKNIVDQAGFAVLKAPDVPSILVETAFISNPVEERKLCTLRYQQQVAEAILSGIKTYF